MNTGHGYQAGNCVTCGVSTRALQAEVEVLRRRLLDRDVAIVQLEAQMAQDRHHHHPAATASPSPDQTQPPPPHPHTHHYPQGQVAVLRAQCDHWQDKYDRLLEAHKRLQKVNQGLEDKLLRLVDRTESEKSSLTADTANLTTALTTAAQAINRLKQENDRYRNDLNLAIQLLQCNPSKYAAHKLDSLPSDLQRKAKSRLAREPREAPKPEVKVIKVPIPTFPPTAMVYSVNKYAEENTKEEPVDAVSAAIMAAVLEERQKERARQHCSTCTCGSPGTLHTPHASPPHPGSEDDPNGNPHNPHNPPSSRSQGIGGLGFRVSVVDVGTQVFPSYIGETGKVQSTCIYCHHSPRAPVPPHSSEVNGKGRSGHEDGVPSRPPKTASPDSAWDWAAEGQDSGSPSTPSSLVSASLSYESETSNVTSPQESPGRLSLLPTSSSKPQGCGSLGGGYSVGSGCTGLYGSGGGVAASPTSPHSSPDGYAMGNGMPRHLPPPVSYPSYHQSYHPPTTMNIPHSPPDMSPSPPSTTTHYNHKHHHYKSHHNHHHRLQFNARSPSHDVFTPPIHRSPPQRHRTTTERSWSPEVIAASTYTSSSTETTL
ncbi:tight junction-associated protein 1-like isoform X2 [Eriocheir sinensis]|nr:tight junction-associated protein 1-like isoform X2 [Eriocheir sinensis]